MTTDSKIAEIVLVHGDGALKRLIGSAEATIERVHVDELVEGEVSPGKNALVLVAPTTMTPAQKKAAAGSLADLELLGCYVVSAKAAQPPKAWAELVDGVVRSPLEPVALTNLADLHEQARRSESEAARMRVRSRTLQKKLDVLSSTLRAAGSLLDPRMVTRSIMYSAAELMSAQRWRLYRIDESSGLLRLDSRSEPADEDSADEPLKEIPIGEGVVGATAQSTELLQIKDVAKESRFQPDTDWPGQVPESMLCTPLVSRGRVIGVGMLADLPPTKFNKVDVDLLKTLIEPAAIALDNAELFRKLEERTITDDLTKLYNARFMESFLRREVKRAIRYKHPLALLFIDLDGFKQVNDVHGHMAGSRTLVEVGQVMRECVREVDVCARWGGDEFTVVLPETGAEGAWAMAERLRRQIGQTKYLQDLELNVRVSASIGVAAYPDHGDSSEALLAAADMAMYSVKNGGKNNVCLAETTDVLVPTGD